MRTLALILILTLGEQQLERAQWWDAVATTWRAVFTLPGWERQELAEILPHQGRAERLGYPQISPAMAKGPRTGRAVQTWVSSIHQRKRTSSSSMHGASTPRDNAASPAEQILQPAISGQSRGTEAVDIAAAQHPRVFVAPFLVTLLRCVAEHAMEKAARAAEGGHTLAETALHHLRATATCFMPASSASEALARGSSCPQRAVLCRTPACYLFLARR